MELNLRSKDMDFKERLLFFLLISCILNGTFVIISKKRGDHMEYSPKKMQENLTDHQFYFKKNYGQNFIIDKNIINKIVQASNIDSDTIVIEVGPGAGSLTLGLAHSAKQVQCYEIDQTLQPILDENLKSVDNVIIYYEDFLKSNPMEHLKDQTYSKLYVIGNLPYYITTPIIMKIIEEQLPVDKMIVMVQKEVGDRFKATPGTRDYGSLTVFLNYYYETRKLLDVSRNVFLPKPNVDSIVVEFSRKKELLPLENETFFFQFVRDCFKQKRKNLRNNLKAYDLEQMEISLKQAGYSLQDRAEKLSLEAFVQVANEYVRKKENV